MTMTRRCIASVSAVLLVALASTRAFSSEDPSSWVDSPVTRLEALALIETLNAELLSHESATSTLEHWCADHRLADPARIIAERESDAGKAPSPQQRAELHVGPGESFRYRHVRLRCGTHVLSEAENWYIPGRLTPEMNRTLETTDTPFGRAVASLHFQRHTIEAQRLWSPLPADWATQAAPGATGAGHLPVPHQILRHRAVLVLPDGTPIAEVIETYTAEVLAFPQPKLIRSSGEAPPGAGARN